jgi:hypothetical protein
MTTWGRRENCQFYGVNADIQLKYGLPVAPRTFYYDLEKFVKDFEEAGFINVKVWY